MLHNGLLKSFLNIGDCFCDTIQYSDLQFTLSWIDCHI